MEESDQEEVERGEHSVEMTSCGIQTDIDCGDLFDDFYPELCDSPEPSVKSIDDSESSSQKDKEGEKRQNPSRCYVKMISKDVGSFIGEKEIGPDCQCPSKCYTRVGEEAIREIFRDFWALSGYNVQNKYLYGLMHLLKVKRRYTKNEVSRRNFTITYAVLRRGERVTVCKNAFLNIHGLQGNRGRVNNLTKKLREGGSLPPSDQRGRHANRPNAYSEEAVTHVKNQIKGLKQIEYSPKKCYELYVSVYCKKHKILPVSLDKYRRVFWEEGYSSKQVKKEGGSIIRKLGF